MSKRKYILDLLEHIIGDKIKAEVVMERLTDEGVLVLGYGDADVDKIVDKFKETFGTTKTSKIDRYSAHRLGAKYGSQAVTGIIQILGDNQGVRYAPVVNSVADLESKWVSILNFVRNLKSDEVIDV